MKRGKTASTFLSVLLRISILVWLLCIVSVILVVGYATKWFQGTVQDTQFGNSNLFVFLFVGLIGLGILAFCILALSLSIKTIVGNDPFVLRKSRKRIIGLLIKRILLIAVFPIVAIVKTVKGKKSFSEKLVGVLFSLFVFVPVWAVSIGIFFGIAWFMLVSTGLAKIPLEVQGSSMLPTVSDGGSIPLKQFSFISILKPKLQRGDIVVFENADVDEALKKMNKAPGGYLKRVIGVPGDMIEIKDGFVWINDQIADEPYTLKPRSTYGGSTVKDCQKIKVPEDKLFVLGDNRKRSEDSRALGFISSKDVQSYLPYGQQQQFKSQWRDPAHDKDAAKSTMFDAQKYIELVNQKRVESKLKPLKYQELLSKSAEKRAKVMLETNDLSFEATKSGYTMVRATRSVGYANTVYGEFPTLGYYDAQELVDNFFEYPDAKEFLLHKDYQEIGISTFVGNLNECPVQIVVQHLAGYIPPNYKKEVVDSWKTVLSQLKEVLPSWEKIHNFSATYNSNKQDADRLLELMRLRISRIEAIVSKMEANKWLSDEENSWTQQDEALYNEQGAIAKRLNAQVWR